MTDGSLGATQSAVEAETPNYRIRAVPLGLSALGHLIADWKRVNVRYGNDILDCDPEWLFEQFRNEESKVRVFLLEKDGEFAGAVPFEQAEKPHPFRLGKRHLARLPFKSLRLLGYSLSIPAETAAYNALFSEIAKATGDFDGLYLGHVEVGSFLWKYLHTSPLIKKHFRYYCRLGPQPHPLIRFEGTFDDYMRKFSAKARKNRLREARILSERFQVELQRITRAEEVDRFVEAVAVISGKTWKSQLQIGVLAAFDLSVWQRRLTFAAERGWLRSYLLKCDGTGCAFIIGVHHHRRYYHMVVGYDQAWGTYSVGSVLQLMVLEHLFNDNPPEVYDFGVYFDYKGRLSNESYLEALVCLFGRRPYPLLVQTLDRAWTVGARQAAALLERLHLKSTVRNLLRS
jgi:Acetyltransferase (GNAT) domain